MFRGLIRRKFCSDEGDHRTIGKLQNLFTFNKMSPGSPFYLPHGTKIYNKLLTFMKQEQRKRGYLEVITPNIYNAELWQQSGHFDKYKEHMYFIQDEVHKQVFGLKPMNCPGHCLMYASQQHSYRELPVRYADFGALHRNEVHGSLSGLTRVRRFTQDDAHIFCTLDQVQTEIADLLDFIDVVYKVFGFSYTTQLSTRPDEYIGDLNIWNEAEQQLVRALGSRNFSIKDKDGAFYGPKIDIHLQDTFNRQHQCGTIQLDFNLPQRFNLEYKNQADSFQQPVMIHRAIFGSFERMIAILTEQTKGKWPFWLSPRQVLVVNVNPNSLEYAKRVHKQIFDSNLESETDFTDHTLAKKVKTAHSLQYNYIVVIGEKEVLNNQIDVRERDSRRHRTMSVEEFISIAQKKNDPFYKE